MSAARRSSLSGRPGEPVEADGLPVGGEAVDPFRGEVFTWFRKAMADAQPRQSGEMGEATRILREARTGSEVVS